MTGDEPCQLADLENSMGCGIVDHVHDLLHAVLSKLVVAARSRVNTGSRGPWLTAGCQPHLGLGANNAVEPIRSDRTSSRGSPARGSSRLCTWPPRVLGSETSGYCLYTYSVSNAD